MAGPSVICEHGSELTFKGRRGLYEPSVTGYGGRFYLTMRADESAFVSSSEDGINYSAPAEWKFDDGQPLGSCNAQQHWVAHSDALHLVYSRRGASNDHVFRNRAPLFIARVDPGKLCVIRATEQILMPETGLDLAGGFAVLDVQRKRNVGHQHRNGFPEGAHRRIESRAARAHRLEQAEPAHSIDDPPASVHERHECSVAQLSDRDPCDRGDCVAGICGAGRTQRRRADARWRGAARGCFPARRSRDRIRCWCCARPTARTGRSRTPYVKAGYIVVRQDARGRYASDGKWESFYRFDTHDAEDGYDTVEWAAKLPGSNGKVGTFGVSYNAFLQWRLAPLRPPSLVAMAARSIPPRLTQLEGPGTIRPGRRLNWFYAGMSPDMRLRSGAEGPKTKAEAGKLWKDGEGERLLHFLPWLDLPKMVFEDEDDAVKAWLRAPHRDPWQFVESLPRDQRAESRHRRLVRPLQRRHRDASARCAAWAGREAARNGQRLIIGPWSHTGHGSSKVGTVDFGKSAALDIAQTEIRWFDYWLKGKANGVNKDAPVRIFVMGANQWRDEQEWPPGRATPHTLYLHSDGKANTPAGDGRLAEEPPAAAHDTYRYDPHDPVPTLWSANMFTLPADQAPLAKRQDILVYQTEPLAAAMEVTGYPEVILHAASSAPDTDFFARLIDVAPDGTNRDIASGMVRARYRDGLDKPKLLKPGEVIEYRIKLRPTSNEFQPGHRIRLDITSSDFPNYDRNHNTAADPERRCET